jgi:hypothetical protein
MRVALGSLSVRVLVEPCHWVAVYITAVSCGSLGVSQPAQVWIQHDMRQSGKSIVRLVEQFAKQCVSKNLSFNFFDPGSLLQLFQTPNFPQHEELLPTVLHPGPRRASP